MDRLLIAIYSQLALHSQRSVSRPRNPASEGVIGDDQKQMRVKQQKQVTQQPTMAARISRSKMMLTTTTTVKSDMEQVKLLDCFIRLPAVSLELRAVKSV
jgi:hypothetical protein